MKQRDRRLAVRPRDLRRQKMRELGFLLDRMSELGSVERQRIGLMAAHQFNCRHHEKLERHHRGNWIPRQTKCWLLLSPAEDSRLARANRNRVEEKLRAELAKNLLNQIILTDGHSARKDQNIRF